MIYFKVSITVTIMIIQLQLLGSFAPTPNYYVSHLLQNVKCHLSRAIKQGIKTPIKFSLVEQIY